MCNWLYTEQELLTLATYPQLRSSLDCRMKGEMHGFPKVKFYIVISRFTMILLA